MSKRFCVYTVITGGFDTIKQPLVTDERFDYVIFSDVPINDAGVWQVRNIEYKTTNNRLLSRFPKIHPDIVLPEYSAWLYIDGTLQITSKYVYDRCVKLANDGIDWAAIKHQYRQCAYEEMDSIINLKWVHDYDCIEWYRIMRNDNYPFHNNLFENNIIFRLNVPSVKCVNDIWWWSMENYVSRDQFSLNYAVWKIKMGGGLHTTWFLSDKEDAWHNEGHFLYSSHTDKSRRVDRTLFEKCRNACVRMKYGNGSIEGDHIYTDFFEDMIKYRYPKLMMFLWTIKSIPIYGIKVIKEKMAIRIDKYARR